MPKPSQRRELIINLRATIFLLAFPVALMGVVQLAFALLSLLLFHDNEAMAFFEPGIIMTLCAGIMIAVCYGFDVNKIKFRESLIYATVTWVVMGLLGAIPISEIAHLSATDAIFESISALTTTGATVISGLDDMQPTFLLYRQFLQWLGGLGVVIFVVAVLPMLNAGGMKLLRAETPGPIKDDKLSPKIAHTAHYLWGVYVVITLLCTVSFMLVGLSPYEALAHALTTVSTGGFSTHDASLGYFQSSSVLLVADLFMVLGAINFALHFRVARKRSLNLYWRDEETRFFLTTIALMSALITIPLITSGLHVQLLDAFNEALFHLISFMTSTGFSATSLGDWPPVVLMLLLISGYFGGCAGSTAGGNKMIRNLLCTRMMMKEMKLIMHPHGVFHVRYQSRPVERPVLSATIAFMFLAATSSAILTLLLLATGLDFWSSLSAVAACLNVLGPAFGALGNNFQPVSDIGTDILSFAMLLGRLEYFTVLVLFVPAFWRH